MEYSGTSEYWTDLGPTILSFIDRLSSLQRLKCISIIEKGLQVHLLLCPSIVGGSILTMWCIGFRCGIYIERLCVYTCL